MTTTDTDPGIVYLLRHCIDGITLHKIGLTRVSLDRRLAPLRDPDVVHHVTVPNCRAVEEALHRHFEARRWAKSEWFTLTPFQEAEAIRLMDALAPDPVAEARKRVAEAEARADRLRMQADWIERQQQQRRRTLLPAVGACPKPPEPPSEVAAAEAKMRQHLGLDPAPAEPEQPPPPPPAKTWAQDLKTQDRNIGAWLLLLALSFGGCNAYHHQMAEQARAQQAQQQARAERLAVAESERRQAQAQRRRQAQEAQRKAEEVQRQKDAAAAQGVSDRMDRDRAERKAEEAERARRQAERRAQEAEAKAKHEADLRADEPLYRRIQMHCVELGGNGAPCRLRRAWQSLSSVERRRQAEALLREREALRRLRLEALRHAEYGRRAVGAPPVLPVMP